MYEVATGRTQAWVPMGTSQPDARGESGFVKAFQGPMVVDNPLLRSNISHLGKRKIIFKHVFGRGYVSSLEDKSLFFEGIARTGIAGWSGMGCA